MAGDMRMITVAGFNTSIDRRVNLPGNLRPGAVQRAESASAVPGGKGLHVAQTIAALGESVRLIGLSDVKHGGLIARHLQSRGVEWCGVQAPGDLRQCFALHEPGGIVTEILEPSAEIDPAPREALLDAVRASLADSSALVLSGSLPRGFAQDTYAGLARESVRRKVPSMLDTSGEALGMAVAAGAWMVKSNAEEAASLVGHAVCTVEDAARCARWLHRQGVMRAVVTLGRDGAVGFDGSTMWHAWSDPCEVRNTVGSGDCFLAALAVGTARTEPLELSMRFSVACGAVNAASDETGYVDAARVAAWMPHVHVQKIHACAGTVSHQCA